MQVDSRVYPSQRLTLFLKRKKSVHIGLSLSIILKHLFVITINKSRQTVCPSKNNLFISTYRAHIHQPILKRRFPSKENPIDGL